MVRVIAFFTTQNHGARETRMAKLAMGTLPALRRPESGSFQIGNQLADFSRHE
jgi:hypothetical protein